MSYSNFILYPVTEIQVLSLLPYFHSQEIGLNLLQLVSRFCFKMFFFSILLVIHLCGVELTPQLEVTDAENFPISVIGQRAAQIIRNRLLRRNDRVKFRTKEICYETVGCFPMPRTQVSPLKKPPQPPEEVDTKFILLNKDNSTSEQFLKYAAPNSITESTFDLNLPCRFVVHGFKGSSKDKGALSISSALLNLGTSNVILVDWHKGAAGPSYVAAASNTQLVGRQLALLILDLISIGSNPAFIHVIGFSLGAHIAGYAGRALQEKGVKIGRITGLDPASILFRELLTSSLSPLGKNDAKFVDVIHTDGTRFLSEGLGIFRPIGHSDYFPNGGLNQPGCNHVRGAVIVSHLGGSLTNASLVCNHIRAWQLFHESLNTTKGQCEFISFPCPGGWSSFQKGNCFPSRCTASTCSKMGFPSYANKILGPLYLVTRDSSPFCGYQLKASVTLSKSVSKFRGYLQLSLSVESDETHIHLYSEEELQGGYNLHGLAAAKYGTISPDLTPSLTVNVSCHRLISKQQSTNKEILKPVLVDDVSVRDIYGNVWSSPVKNLTLNNINGTTVDAITLELHLSSV